MNKILLRDIKIQTRGISIRNFTKPNFYPESLPGVPAAAGLVSGESLAAALAADMLAESVISRPLALRVPPDFGKRKV